MTEAEHYRRKPFENKICAVTIVSVTVPCTGWPMSNIPAPMPSIADRIPHPTPGLSLAENLTTTCKTANQKYPADKDGCRHAGQYRNRKCRQAKDHQFNNTHLKYNSSQPRLITPGCRVARTGPSRRSDEFSAITSVHKYKRIKCVNRSD